MSRSGFFEAAYSTADVREMTLSDGLRQARRERLRHAIDEILLWQCRQ